METHRIRGNQRPGRSNRIGDTVSLAIVFVDAIRHEEAQSWQELGRQIGKEEIVSGEIQAVTLRVVNTVKEEVDDRVAINPVVVVTSAQ